MIKKIIMLIVITTIFTMIGIASVSGAPLKIDSPLKDITQEATGELTTISLEEPTTTGGNGTITIENDAPIDGFKIGTTIVTWTAEDSDIPPNTDSKTQTVIITHNNPPIITILGTNPKTINVGDTYTDAGATAEDIVDGIVDVTTTGTVDTTTAGTYTITYTAVDKSGNTATETRTVHVVDVSNDNIPPIITVIGTNPKTINVGDNYIDLGAIAEDNIDGDITKNIVTNNPVDTNVSGTYVVTYDVTDSAGNAAQQKSRIVHVKGGSAVDNIPPTITAPADITVQATGTSTHVNLGTPIVTDNIDPNPTVTNNAPTGNNFSLGTTTVTWTATDNSGNSNNDIQLVTVISKLAILSYDPASLVVDDTAPSNIKFSIKMNQAANVVWSIDGVSTRSAQSVTEDSYRTNFSTIGSHVLTVNVQNGTDSDTKTWNWNIQGTLQVSAHPAFVNVGKPTSVILRVSRRCGIESTDNCTGRTPVSGASVSLTGIVTDSGKVNDTTGEFVTIINTTANGTINVTASKSGYVNGYGNITVGIAPTPVPTSPPSGGSSGGSSNSGGSSGGSSGGGGGGGGGTAEPYENILKYEIQERNVFTTPVSFKYVTPELGIYEVMVTSTQSDIAALRIEVLKDTSKLVNISAPGIVYKNINAWIDYKRIKNATMRFKVENAWLSNNGLKDTDVKMSKWESTSKRWIGLPTTLINKDNQYTYFESQTNSFSSFAIGASRSSTAANSATMATSTVGPSPIPIDTNVAKRKYYTNLEIGIVVIVVVLIFYVLRIKKNQ